MLYYYFKTSYLHHCSTKVFVEFQNNFLALHDMQRLTQAEEQVMLRLWGLKEATVKDIIQFYPVPKPAYNTTSTIVRILERKKFIGHKKKGRGFVYYAKISKEVYRAYLANWLVDNYFDCSNQEVINHFNRNKQLDELL